MTSTRCTAFNGFQRLAAGPLPDIAVAVKAALKGGALGPVLIYDDATGHVIDVDTRGTAQEIASRPSRLRRRSRRPGVERGLGRTRGPGRPKLGVVAREVTLLPRHWDWLNTQPGGASVALRKLVEEARRTNGAKDRRRAAQEAAYRFMSAMAGNLPGFEEATRALFANDRRRLSDLVAGWPPDVRDYAIQLAFADLDPDQT